MKGSLSHNKEKFRYLINAMFINSWGGDKRARIIETKDIFPRALEFEKRFPEVKAEVCRLLEKRSLTTYKEIDPLRAAEVSNNWKLYYVYFFGRTNKQAEIDCPIILEIVRSIPNAINASISLLDPGVELAAHSGPYAGILRYHLGLIVPKNNPPSLRVDQQWHTWTEGRGIVFDDFFEHEVVNKSDGMRVILMVDFLRPMNPIYNAINRFSMWLNRKWSAYLINKTNGSIE